MADRDLRALTALRRLRHVETDAVRRDLAQALTLETALAGQDDALRREIDAARQHSGDFDRDAFLAWFGRKQAERARLAAAVREAVAHSVAARTALAQRRVGEQAAEDALAAAILVRDAELARREQIMLEDVARVLKRASDRESGTGPK